MTPDDLERIAAEERERAAARALHVHVCQGTGCIAAGSEAVLKAVGAAVADAGLEHRCAVRGTGCRGLCSAGPIVGVEPAGVLYEQVGPGDAPALVAWLDTPAALAEGLDAPAALPRAVSSKAPFFARQRKVVLENAGRIDPEDIKDYIAHGGYAALAAALTEMQPAEALDAVARSGLRGRGGAGYPTGLKWSTVAKTRARQKYVICNGDEGDPGAFMDRSVMEADPHRILEGMAIAGYAVGATQGYLFVRAEYELAIKRLKTAIAQAKREGLIGEGIFDTSVNFNVSLRLGGGAFVCGEETALIASTEGQRGQPRPRPPYPAVSGLWGCPTLVNNVETFANVPAILRNGAEWYAGIGTGRSKGTKLFALAGRVNNVGLIEVPMGISLREIVYDIGGGVPQGRTCKAVQTGGPSGGCVPASLFDHPVDYESLVKLGSIMGSGGMIVMDDSACMVDVARYYMEFCMTESCGKCVPCRAGTVQMHGLLSKISSGEASLDDLALLEDLCDVVKHTSLCGLGQHAPNPVISTLHHFRGEYLAHIVEKRCPAGVCAIAAAQETAP